MTELRHAEIRAAGDLLHPVLGGVSAASAVAGGAPLLHRPWVEAADEVKNALAPDRPTS